MRATLLVLSLTAGLAITWGRGLSAQTTTAYKSREETTGATKQCYYTALGNVYTRTVSVTELCPQTIEVERVSSRLDLPERAARQPRSDPWTALGQGLQETAALLQAQRDAQARRESDSVRASLFQAEVERACRNAVRAQGEQVDSDIARRTLAQVLVREFETSEAYTSDVATYNGIREREGVEAANRYWLAVRADEQAYVSRRWAELAPRLQWNN